MWTPSIQEEYNSLIQTGSLRAITEEEAEELRRSAEGRGIPYDRLPGKAVFTKKAPNGKLKCRGVACGNFMAARPASETYAGGIDATQVRSVLCSAVQGGWSIAGTDIKTAFLQVPAGRVKDVIIIQPPAIFYESGVCQPGELWHVNGNIYGLTTSPRDWSNHRDHTLPQLRWDTSIGDCFLQKTREENQGRIRCQGDQGEVTVGHIAVYIDDLLVTGEKEVVSTFFTCLRKEWTISDPDWCEGDSTLRFCGLEVTRQGDGVRLHRESYVRDLLDRNGTKGTSLMSSVSVPEEEGEPSAEDVKRAQIATGELLWVATRTRPEVSYPVSLMCQWAVRRPKGVIRIGEEVRKYLNGTKDEGLLYLPLKEGDHGPQGLQHRAKQRESVEVFCDASFGSNQFKSTSGFVAYYAGCPVFWLTSRQPFIALSTAEAELLSLMEGVVASKGVSSLVEELEEKSGEKRLYSDSSAAIAIINGSSGSWRTRHLRMRAHALSGSVKEKEIILQHFPGKFLVADGFTKQLAASLFRRFKENLRILGEEGKEVKENRVMNLLQSEGEKIQSALKAMMVLGSLQKIAITAASEDTSWLRVDRVVNGTVVEKQFELEGDGWFPLILLVFAMCLVKIVKMIGKAGIKMLQRGSDIQVERLREESFLPERLMDSLGGWSLRSCESVTLGPGETALVRTGLKVKMPSGMHGRLSTSSELLMKKGEIGEGFLTPVFGEEVKVLIRNLGTDALIVEPSSVVARLNLLQNISAPIREVTDAGRGTTAPSIQSLRAEDATISNDVSSRVLGREETVWSGRNFRSMKTLIQAKRREFPAWIVDDHFMDLLSRPPEGIGADTWQTLEMRGKKVVVKSHRQQRMKMYTCRDQDVAGKPSMTFAWHENGTFQVRYTQNPTAFHLDLPWTGFSVFNWGLS